MRRLLRLSLPLLTLFLFLAGCGAMKNNRGWGQDATLLPGWNRLGNAVVTAAVDPHTWAPTAGAIVFGTTHLDKAVSDWAVDHHPIYGSTHNALKASNSELDYGQIAWIATALATPSGDTAGTWAWSKTKGLAVEFASIGVSMGVTSELKSTIPKERPDESNNQSFPSNHSTKAFSQATLGRRNLDAIDMPGYVRIPLDVGFDGLALATAWARVEGEKHYPSDVLAGAALANFFTTFVNEAFLGLDNAPVQLTALPDPRGVTLGLAYRF